jgi:hypothetical protein
MNSKILFLVLFLIIIAGCSDNPLEEVQSDSYLQSSIIGSWNLDNEKYMFCTDASFIDSAYTYVAGNNVLFYVRKGSYEINNSVLVLKTDQWKFYDTTYVRGLSILPDDQEIEIENGKMSWKPVEVFTPKNKQNNGLFGEWETTKWVFRNTTETGYSFYCGKEKHYYIFKKDTTQMFFGWNNLEGNNIADANYESVYKYIFPKLYLSELGVPSKIVKFKNGLLYFYCIEQEQMLLTKN